MNTTTEIRLPYLWQELDQDFCRDSPGPQLDIDVREFNDGQSIAQCGGSMPTDPLVVR